MEICPAEHARCTDMLYTGSPDGRDPALWRTCVGPLAHMCASMRATKFLVAVCHLATFHTFILPIVYYSPVPSLKTFPSPWGGFEWEVCGV